MSKSISFEKPDVLLSTDMTAEHVALDPDAPFCVALIGDWSGRASGGSYLSSDQISELKPVSVDRDNIENVLSRLSTAITLSLDEEGQNNIKLSFSEIDDFHPDSIFRQASVFKSFREVRSALNNPKTFADAADIVRGWTSSSSSTGHKSQSSVSSAGSTAGDVSDAGLLDQMLSGGAGQAPVRTTGSAADDQEWNKFLGQLVSPHLTTEAASDKEELVAVVDSIVAGVMRLILHHPDFQALEAAWRALDLMVRSIETSSKLKLYLIDVSMADLIQDIAGNEDVRQSGLYRLLVDKSIGTAGAERWSLICGNYEFDSGNGSLGILHRLSQIAQAAGTSFIAGADPSLAGAGSVDELQELRGDTGEISETWGQFRRLSGSDHLGLALPRFLLRLPYGADTDATENFDFEEFEGEPAHEDFLWGNSSFVCAQLLCKGFALNDWSFRPGDNLELEGLPLFTFEVDGESETKPCGEVLLTERNAEAILEQGLMPLVSFKNGDTVRLLRFQSISDPPSALFGNWG